MSVSANGGGQEGAASPLGSAHSPTRVTEQHPPADAPPAGDAPAAPNVDVHINGGDRVVWYTNPMLLAVGGIGLLLLIVVVAMASRGNGGTTIIREK